MSLRYPGSLVRHYAGCTDPDNRTSMADTRIALCAARGVDLDDIDPTTGYNYSRSAYDDVRQSWIWNIKQHGYSRVYEGEGLARAVANWTAHRPDFIAGDDWLTAATAAHHAYWAEKGVPCPRETCDLHPAEDYSLAGATPGPDAQEPLFADITLPQATASALPLARRPITDLHLPA